jgi:UDP-glucose-4-epimerase GalE
VVHALRFLDAARGAGLRNLVFSSSCAIYGVQTKMPIAEDAPVSPLNAYAESKLFFERVLRDYDRAYGLKHANLRYFNAAGADPAGEIGEAHDPETHLIPNAIYATMGRGRLKVFGTDYPTPDGTPLRDYIHVSDLAAAHVRAVEYLEAGGASDSFNLGAGRGTSVLEIIRLVEEITGREVARDIGPRRAGDAPVLIGDLTKARRVLGWEPRLSDLDTIIRTACAWHAGRS